MSAEEEISQWFGILNDGLFGGRVRPLRCFYRPKNKFTLKFVPGEGIVLGVNFYDLEPSSVPLVLLHEIVHAHNYQSDVVDCTANQYHNKLFLKSALEVGLVVIKHRTQGWAITTTLYPRNVTQRDSVRRPTIEAVRRREEVFASLKINKEIFSKKSREECPEKPVKVYFLKYVCNCPPPHNSIRSGRRPDGPNALRILCKNCQSHFVCASPL